MHAGEPLRNEYEYTCEAVHFFVKKIRASFRNAKIVMIVEAVLNYPAPLYSYFQREREPLIWLQENIKEGRAYNGAPINHSIKKDYIRVALRELREKNIVLHPDRWVFSGVSLKQSTNAFRAQLVSMEITWRNSGDFVLSGKHAGNDDIAMAFLMGIYYRLRVKQKAHQYGVTHIPHLF